MIRFKRQKSSHPGSSGRRPSLPARPVALAMAPRRRLPHIRIWSRGRGRDRARAIPQSPHEAPAPATGGPPSPPLHRDREPRPRARPPAALPSLPALAQDRFFANSASPEVYWNRLFPRARPQLRLPGASPRQKKKCNL